MPLEREVTTLPDPPSDRFIWDMPESVFSAVDNDGNDVTDQLDEPEGSIIFRHSVAGSGYACDCPKMILDFEWDALIPAPYGYY